MNTTDDNMQSSALGLPKEYTFCFLSECPSAKDCARFFASQHTGDRELGTVVLPAAMNNGKCKWFKRMRKVRGAWGFNRLFGEVRAKDAPYLRKMIKDYLGGNGTYYLYQHGKRLLTPEQQEWIMSLFKRHGYNDELEFDGYQEAYDW